MKIYPISKVSPNDTKIELTCRAVKSVLLYFEEKYGRAKLEDFIYDTKMNLYYIENKNNWISYSYFCRLLAKLVEYTGDPNTPYIVGTYSHRKECFDALANIVRRLGSPGTTYKLIEQFTPRYSKLGEFKISNMQKNNCIMTVRYFKEFKQDKNNCLNLQGIFAAVPSLLGLPLAKVKEIECATEGGDSCIYNISWINRPSHLYGLYGLIGGLILYCGMVFVWNIRDYLILSLVLLLGYFLGRIKDYRISLKNYIEVNERESKDLMESIEAIEKLNVKLQDKIEQRTAELNAINKELQKTLDDLEKSKAQLIQSEKMASVGRLAAGMAHELNNPVGAIRNYLQDILEDISQKDPFWDRLKRAEKATGRCKKIVDALLTFVSQNKVIKSVDIKHIIETTVLKAEKEISNPNIEIFKELEVQLPEIKVASIQIEQVLMNIIMNAKDAIKDEGYIKIKSYKDSENIYVEISDNGEGIPEEIQDKIFDPFFTTKSPGNGMGLGLAISYNIVKEFNGDIRVNSRKGKETIFIITLPMSNNAM
ncbi:MAG: ATP-binding protein [bacterium]